MENCKVESCERESRREGLCYPHYKRFIRTGTTELYTRKCSVDGCEEKHGSKGFCWKHYYKLKRDEAKEAPKKVKAESKPSIIFKDGKWKIQDDSDYVPIRE